MIAWYSPARSSFSSWIICSRVIMNPDFMFSLVIICFPFHARLHLVGARASQRLARAQASTVKPTFVRAFYGLGNSVFDGSGGSAREFDEFIDWVFHTRFFRTINRQTMRRYGVF